MYTVVGCGECGSLWIVDGRPDTTACRRCGKRHRFDSLRPLARTETQAAARAARTELLADRSDGEGVEVGVDATITGADVHGRRRGDDAPVETEDRSGDRGPGSSPRTIVRRAIRRVDRPTTARIVEFATRRDVPESEARRTLERLVRSGEATEAEGTYRLL